MRTDTTGKWAGKPAGKPRDRILIVDDEQDARELIASVLGEAGYSVELAGDGFEAINKLSAVRPDLVLTDLRMPGLTGVDLAQRIRALGDVPIILMTGTETHDLCTGAEAYGAVACLTKPINLDELLWTIDTALACRPAESAAASAVANA
jgi:two-component system response regulator MprA